MIPYRLGKTITFKVIESGGGGGGGGADLVFQGIEMHRLPNKLEYEVGELLTFEGMEIFALYEYNEEIYMKDISDDATPSIPEGTAVTEDMVEISFTYTEQGLTDITDYDIEVFAGYSWSRSTDEKIVEAMTKAYSGEIDLSEYFHVGDVREVELTDGRTVHFVLQANNNNKQGASGDSHGTTAGKFLVTMQEYFQGYSEMYNYAQTSSSATGITMNELKIPKKNERGWEDYTFYSLIPDSIKSIFRLFSATGYTTNGNYALKTVSGNVHFGYYSGYWFDSSKGYRPSGYYDSVWYDSDTYGTTKKENEVPKFVNVDNISHEGKYIAAFVTEKSSAANYYTTSYIGVEDNACYVAFNGSMTLKKSNGSSVTATLEDMGVSFIGMI